MISVSQKLLEINALGRLKNAISETLYFKIFTGSMRTDPPNPSALVITPPPPRNKFNLAKGLQCMRVMLSHDL